MTRKLDNKDLGKHLKAIRNIRPVCSAKPMFGKGKVQTARAIIDWQAKKIRCGLVIGTLIDGEPHLTDIGMLCLEQWMRGHPSQTIVFAEFKHVATGNIVRLRGLLIKRLAEMEKHGDNALLLLVAKNSTMYDKIGALIGLCANLANDQGNEPKQAQLAAGSRWPPCYGFRRDKCIRPMNS